MSHRPVAAEGGNVRCSCGHMFSRKGFPIHAGMMNKPSMRSRIRTLIAKYRNDDTPTWIEQVPYVVRTEVVSDLESLLEAL